MFIHRIKQVELADFCTTLYNKEVKGLEKGRLIKKLIEKKYDCRNCESFGPGSFSHFSGFPSLHSPSRSLLVRVGDLLGLVSRKEESIKRLTKNKTMTSKKVIEAVKKLDGVIIREKENNVFALCRGYDVEFIGGTVLTIRRTKDRGHYDAGSDYNPGGYMFLRRIKDLNYHLMPQA